MKQIKTIKTCSRKIYNANADSCHPVLQRTTVEPERARDCFPIILDYFYYEIIDNYLVALPITTLPDDRCVGILKKRGGW